MYKGVKLRPDTVPIFPFDRYPNIVRCRVPKNGENLVSINRLKDIFQKFTTWTCQDKKIELEPMDARERRWLHTLAAAYGLEASVGSLEWGKSREQDTMVTMIVYRTKVVKIPRDYDKIIAIQKEIKFERWMDLILPTTVADSYSPVAERKKKEKLPSWQGLAAKAPGIPESNWGYQHLQQIGWEPGKGVGPTLEGPIEPIPITILPNRQGLGHLTKAQLRALEEAQLAKANLVDEASLVDTELGNSSLAESRHEDGLAKEMQALVI